MLHPGLILLSAVVLSHSWIATFWSFISSLSLVVHWALMVVVVLVPVATAAILIIATIVIMMVMIISVHRIIDLVTTSFLEPIKNIVIIAGATSLMIVSIVVISFVSVVVLAMIVICLLILPFLLSCLIL